MRSLEAKMSTACELRPKKIVFVSGIAQMKGGF